MLLYLILALILCIVAKTLYDTIRLRLEEHDLSHPNTQKPLRILFFSDLHYRYLWIKQREIIRQIKDKPVDLVIFGGDLGYREAEQAFQWMKDFHTKLIEVWDKPELPPIVGVWGNHDVNIPRSMGQSKSFHFFENETYTFEHEGVSWTILGLGDLRTGRRGINTLMETGVSMEDPEHSILLAHNPDTFKLDLPKARLGLAGHYHGGQIRLPFHLEFKILRPGDLFAKEGIIEGMQTVNDQDILISPGVGNTFVPFRFFSHSTIHIIKL